MKINYKIEYLILISTVVLSACNLLTRKIESLEKQNLQQAQSISSASISKKKLYCLENNNTQLYVEDEIIQNFYIKKVFHTKEFQNLSFVQKSIIFSIFEMLRRPDTSGPFSRFQVYLKLDKDYYFDFRPIDYNNSKSLPYLYGLQKIYEKFEKKDKFKNINKMIIHKQLYNLPVSASFENFLLKNKDEIFHNDFLSGLFIKGDETLTKHETFTPDKFSKILDYYYKNNLDQNNLYFSDKNYLIKTNSNENLFCNFDLNTEVSKDDIFNFEKKENHTFALKQGKYFFLAVASSLKEKPLNTIEDTYFFKNKTSPTPIPVCKFESKNLDVILFSSQGRDPSQHLKHLFHYEIFNSDSFLSLTEYLNFPRHLFLSSPERILYESKRGRKSQLEFLLSMNFPLYHVDRIGNIFGLASFKNENGQNYESIFIDERNDNKLWCGQ